MRELCISCSSRRQRAMRANVCHVRGPCKRPLLSASCGCANHEREVPSASRPTSLASFPRLSGSRCLSSSSRRELHISLVLCQISRALLSLTSCTWQIVIDMKMVDKSGMNVSPKVLSKQTGPASIVSYVEAEERRDAEIRSSKRTPELHI